MNIDKFIEHAQESAREHRYHADFLTEIEEIAEITLKSLRNIGF